MSVPVSLAFTTHILAAEEMKAFADISGDHNPLHFDAQYAAGTRFKRPIVFGVLMNACVDGC